MSEITIREAHGEITVISHGDQHISLVNHELDLLIQRLKKHQREIQVEQQQAHIARILLVDDCPALRAGMRLALETTGKFHIVAETGTVAYALELIKKTVPSIIVASLCLPDSSGVVISQKIVELGYRSSVIILSSTDVDACLVEVWRAGAIGLLSKQTDLKQFVNALQLAASGQCLWTDTQLKRIQQWERIVGLVLEKLSIREREVLYLLSMHMTNKGIAHALSLSEKTVEHYVSHVLHKLGVISRTQATQWAEQAFCETVLRKHCCQIVKIEKKS